MQRLVVFLYGLVVCLASVVYTTAYADNVLYTGTGFNNGDQAVTFGIEFTPAVDLTVNSLGVFDGGSDNVAGPPTGLETPRNVGLYEQASGTQLATVTVDNTGVLINGFRFASITPTVQLAAGQKYIVAAHYAFGFPGDKVAASLSNMAPWAQATLNDSLATGGASLVMPTSSFPPGVDEFILSANILFTATASQGGDGDINFDGNVDAADILLATRMVTGNLLPSPAQLVAGDVAPYVGGQSQPDNQFNMSDLVLITRVALGLLTL